LNTYFHLSNNIQLNLYENVLNNFDFYTLLSCGQDFNTSYIQPVDQLYVEGKCLNLTYLVDGEQINQSISSAHRNNADQWRVSFICIKRITKRNGFNTDNASIPNDTGALASLKRPNAEIIVNDLVSLSVHSSLSLIQYSALLCFLRSQRIHCIVTESTVEGEYLAETTSHGIALVFSIPPVAFREPFKCRQVISSTCKFMLVSVLEFDGRDSLPTSPTLERRGG